MKRTALASLVFVLTLAALLRACHAQQAVIQEITPGRTRPQSTPTPRPTPPPTPAPPVFTNPRLLWKTLLKRIDATPTVSSNFLYLGAGDSLYQLDLGGRVQWTADIGPQQAAPLALKTRVIVPSDRGIVQALQVTSGQPAWKFTLPQSAPLQTSPASGDGLIFCLANNDTLYALTLAGQSKWKFALPDGTLGYSSPVADDDAVFCAGDTSVYRLDAVTGKQTWRTFLGGKALSTPFLTPDLAIVGGDGSGVTALSRRDGKTAWRLAGAQPGDWFGPPLVSGSTVYVATYRRYVYALNLRTGTLRWQARLSGSALARPAIDAKRGTLYVTCATFADNPTLVALDTRTGKSRWDFRMGYASGGPLVTGDRLYVGATTGYLYAFSLR